MNRLESVNMDGVANSALPPTRREGPARLLFISGTFLGFKNYHRELVRYTAARDDIDVVHIEYRAPFWLKSIAKSFPVDTRGWDFHSLRFLLLSRRLMNRWLFGPLDATRRFDAVHIMTQGNALSLVDLKRRAPRLALATNIDGTSVQDWKELGFSRAARAPFTRRERRIFDACDLVVGRNRWCVGSVIEDFGLPASRTIVARNSMRPTARSRQDAPERKPGEPVRLVFVGGAWARKGGPELLAMHQRSLAGRAELHVVCGRVTPDRSARNVVWHGAAGRERLLDELLPSMDVFVMPTRNDMHPWAILEAAAVGLPVVSTRLAAIPDIVRDGETGLLCERLDWEGFERAIARLVDDPALRWRMGVAAREHVRANYDPDAQFNGLLDRLVALCDERGAAG